MIEKIKLFNELQKELTKNLNSYCEKIDDFQELYLFSEITTPQKFCKYPENLIIKKFNGTKIPPKKEQGDFFCQEYQYVEFKYSIVRNDKHFGRFLQIRPKQNCNYILQSVMKNENKYYTFYLSNEQMKEEIKIIKGISGSHGANIELTEHKEISLMLDCKDFERWGKYMIEI